MINDPVAEMIEEDVVFLYNHGRHLEPNVQYAICVGNINYFDSPDAVDKTRETHYSIADTVYMKHVWSAVARRVHERAIQQGKRI